MHRIKHGRDYYVLPGGGMELGETPYIAALRELREETGLTEKEALTISQWPTDSDVHFLFHIQSSTQMVSITGPELQRMTDENVYLLEWVLPEECRFLNIVPEWVKGHLIEFDESVTEDLASSRSTPHRHHT